MDLEQHTHLKVLNLHSIQEYRQNQALDKSSHQVLKQPRLYFMQHSMQSQTQEEHQSHPIMFNTNVHLQAYGLMLKDLLLSILISLHL